MFRIILFHVDFLLYFSHMQDYVENNIVHYRKNENQCYFPVDNFRVGNCIYSLRAIALHVGNMQTGHYTAACLNPTNNRFVLLFS